MGFLFCDGTSRLTARLSSNKSDPLERPEAKELADRPPHPRTVLIQVSCRDPDRFGVEREWAVKLADCFRALKVGSEVWTEPGWETLALFRAAPNCGNSGGLDCWGRKERLVNLRVATFRELSPAVVPEIEPLRAAKHLAGAEGDPEEQLEDFAQAVKLDLARRGGQGMAGEDGEALPLPSP